MRLLKPLATGVNGAASGTATIYKRGTSTPATLYTAIDGSGSTTPTSTVSLDANGRAIWYVNEAVDIIAYNSSNSPVATFTDLDGASAVEVMSQSFTGTDYNTGQTGASKPALLSVLMDLWLTNAGAKDWKVLISGVETTLQNAFSTVGGIVTNVKAPAYGAKGDGTSDDTAAISVAFSQTAAGGIVFFPAGTYRITSAIAVGPAVSILGVGPGASIITIDHATNDALQIASSSTVPSSIRGIAIQAKQANSGTLLKINSGSVVNLYDCAIGNSNTNGYCVQVDNNGTKLTAVGNVFAPGGVAAYGVYNNSSAPNVRLFGNRFVSPATHNGYLAYLNGGTSIIVGNVFDCSGTSLGTGAAIGPAGNWVIVGNRFEAPSGGGLTAISVSGVAGANFHAANSIASPASWGSIGGPPNVSASAATHEGTADQSRDGRRYYTTDNTSPVAINGSTYGTCEVRRTNNANQTINGDTPASAGMRLTLVLNNDQAAPSGTITLGAQFKGQAPFTVAANNVRHISFVSSENAAAGAGSATKYWVFAGSSGDVTP